MVLCIILVVPRPKWAIRQQISAQMVAALQAISVNEIGQSLGSGNQARIGNGPSNEANTMMGNSGNLWTMAHEGGSFVAPMNLPRFPGYYPGV